MHRAAEWGFAGGCNGSQGGEADVKNDKHHDAAVPRTRLTDRTSHGPSLARPRFAWRSTLVSIAVSLAVATTPCVPGFVGAAHAQRMIMVGANNRTASIVVAVGKSDDVRTDQPFVDIMVGNPDIADVNALTDHTLSILGKKIGTTRVSIYGADKRLIGVFDVEVSYDTAALAAELARRFPHNRIRVSTVNGRILLSGTATDGVALDEVVQVAKQFGPEIINSIQVMQPQQVMLEVRFIEASREADRELGTQWNIGPRHAQRILFNSVNADARSSDPAGVIGTATPPFGVIATTLLSKGLSVNMTLNALEQRGLARRLAEPNLVALSGETANFLAGGEYPIPVPGLGAGQIMVDYKQYGVSLAFTPTVLSNSLINLKIIPEVSQLDPSNSVSVSATASWCRRSRCVARRPHSSSRTARASCSPACCRTTCRPRSSSCRGSATCRSSARCFPARRTRRTRPT